MSANGPEPVHRTLLSRSAAAARDPKQKSKPFPLENEHSVVGTVDVLLL
jgi:hypothetical protein